MPGLRGRLVRGGHADSRRLPGRRGRSRGQCGENYVEDHYHDHDDRAHGGAQDDEQQGRRPERDDCAGWGQKEEQQQ